MKVKELLQNEYGQYLSQYEKKYLETTGRLHNLETVKKQLGKYFKNVSIRGRGKKAVVYIGKPKPIKGDDLKTALVSQIVRELDPYGRSLSYWCGETGLALVPYKINEKEIEKLPYEDQALARYLIMYARTRQRNYFESAYRQAVKMVGGTWQRVHLGEMTTGQITMIPSELAGELFQITEMLKGQGIRHPAKIKEHDDYQEVLKRYGFSHDWKAYQATYDPANQIKAMTAVTSSDREQVQELFREALRSDLAKHVKADTKKLDNQITKELRELIELHVMTERAVKFDLVRLHTRTAGAYLTSVIDGTTTDKWEEFSPIIFPVLS
ncbi:MULTISPECIES: hypothetical protein [Lactobacillaceae]|uniref:Uncharacterized protein n=1 Tax=Limosilactobacillus pontis TaxID=35787 RepID=A0ABU7SVE5_9LACO